MIRQAVLLVGGRGTRLWPLTATVPKGLVPVAGEPFLDLQLELVRRVGVERVVLAVGTEHLERWKEYAAADHGGIEVELTVEEEPLDTAGSLVAFRDRLDDRFLVLNGDVIIETDLAGFVERAGGHHAALALSRVEDPSAYGVVVTDTEGKVERFVEKPAPGTAPSDTVSAGIYLLERKVFASYDPGRLSFERVVFPALAEAGRLAAFVVEGSWLDIGTPQMLLDTHAHVLGGHSLLRPMSPGAEPWAWLGSGVELGEGAVVRRSVVLAGSRLEAGAVVEDAIIAEGVELGRDSVVRDLAVVGAGAVVGPDVELARGARVAPGAIVEAGAIRFDPPD